MGNKAGRIFFDTPRAVQIREPENLDSIHSAIHSGINIRTDSALETEKIINAIGEILEAANLKIEEILSRG